MINDWKAYLSGRGFEKFARRLFIRPSKPILAMVSEIALGVGKREVRVDLSLEIFDPFRDPQNDSHPVHLTGEVGRSAIKVHNMRSRDYVSSTPWLAPSEKDLVFALLERCMEPWFEHWSAPKRLIEYFLNPPDVVITRPLASGVEHVVARHPGARGLPPLVVKLRSELDVARAPDDGTLPPISIYLLSLLYMHVGDMGRSVEYSTQHLDCIRQRGRLDWGDGEPERTLRQIKALSGP